MAFIAVTSALIRSQNLFNHVAESLPYRSGRAIRDPDVVAFLGQFETRIRLRSSVGNAGAGIEFLRRFPDWLQSSQENRIENLEAFRYVTFANGTLQAFDAFYSEHRNRRFRCFKGEYMYHRAVWRHGYTFDFLEAEPVGRGDAVILSLPFTDSGCKHPLMDEVIDACNRLEVPVLLDCSYLNIASGIDFNVDQPCIKALAFSLSKTFYGLARLRIGVRLKREFSDDLIDLCNTLGAINYHSCACGLAIIDGFGVDFTQTKYRDKQLNICRNLNVEPSNTIIFGLGDENWRAYNRGGRYNRLCLSQLLEE